MTTTTDDPQARLRRSVYWLLIFLSAGAMLGRVLAVDAVDKIRLQDYRVKKVKEKLDRERTKLQKSGLEGESLKKELRKIVEKEGLNDWAELQRPFLSGNDRSRWCTVRALVDDDMRVEGNPYAIDKVIQEPGWDTIDMVKHDDQGRGGLGAYEGNVYSSKPPLFPTLLAGEYWMIKRLTGMTLGTHPYTIGRFMLITVNVIPMIVFLWLLSLLAERLGTTDWGRLFVVAAGAFGTFLTTFSVVINNHLPAAVSAMVAMYAGLRIGLDGERRWRYFILAGVFAAFAAANELPALAFFAALSAVLLWKAPLRTIFIYTPAAALVVGAFLATNWVAHGDLKPPYLHRSETDLSDNWYAYEYQRNGKTHQSYWNDPVGIDRGEPSPQVYAMHVLVGHHGIFSLTPVWLLSGVGIAIWLCCAKDRRLRVLAALIGVVSLACLAFYLTRGLHYRNYGGATSGLRWMFWFAPLWLVTMLPAADAMASRCWTRLVALLLLAVSVLSAAYPTWNPWVHPWLMNYLYYMGLG